MRERGLGLPEDRGIHGVEPGLGESLSWDVSEFKPADLDLVFEFTNILCLMLVVGPLVDQRTNCMLACLSG